MYHDILITVYMYLPPFMPEMVPCKDILLVVASAKSWKWNKI